MIKKAPFFFIVFVFVSFAFSQYGKSYDDKTTHPGLTDEMVDFYNASFDAKLTSEEKEWIVQGAIDEDIPPRWINHFYDPISKEGWQAENLGTVSSFTLKFLSNVFFNTNTKIVSSKQWVHDEFLQIKYADYGGNNTWENAVRQYVNGNKKGSYYILGHVLHLLEDKTVPDHTRNDTHAHEFSSVSKDGGSPYEDYGKNFNRQNLKTAQDLQQSGKQPILLSSIDDYFEHLAKYSNKYFFSEHTIISEKYTNPKIIRENGAYGYGKDKDGKEFNLVEIKLLTKKNFDTERIYTLRNRTVLSSYFSRLTQEAVMSGAGVIKLFHEEVEKASQVPGTIPPEPQVAWWEKMQSPLYGALASYNDARATTISMYNFASSLATNVISFFGNFSSFLPAQLAGLISAGAQPQPQQVPVIPQQQAAPTSISVANDVVLPPREPLQVAQPALQIAIPVPPIPEASTPVAENDPIVAPVVNVMPATPAVVLEIDPLLPSQVFHGSGSVTGVSPDALAAQNNPPAEEQPQDLGVFAAMENTTNETTATTTDATATTTDSVATSTDDAFATSTDPIIDETATTTEDVIVATSTEPTVPVIIDFTDSIVINEVAWMGTKAQANDEWIELYNKSNSDIDLSGWTLESRNGKFFVALSKSIPANGYFLLERTATTTTNQAENLVYSSNKGVLIDSGSDANLYLKNGSTTIDYIDFGYWPFASKKEERRSLERVSAYATSTYTANWKSYGDPDAVPYAKDAKENDILGTPGRKNSVSGFYTPTGDITENMTWKKEYSPYLVSAQIIVKEGAELSIEPGVVVKLARVGTYGGSIDVQGALRAVGTPEDQIVFTSTRNDDSDGIDSGRDGSTSSAPGDWLHITLSNALQKSLIRHVHISYGGQGINYNPNGWYPTFTGVIHAKGSSPEISDSIIENTLAIGIYASDGALPKIAGNVIENTTQPTHIGASKTGAGIVVAADASAEIVGNMLKNNRIGIRSESVTDAPVIVKDNRFDSNAKNGEFIKGYTNWNLENSGNEDVNKEGGFDIQFIVASGQSKTIHADVMPYIIGGGAQILEGGVLVIEPGAVFKFTIFSYAGVVQFSVNGMLSAAGTEEKPIIFTAFADDSDGYDSNMVVTSPVAGAWKYISFSGATSSDSVLEHVIVRYGGQGKDICPYAYLGGPCMEYYGAVNIVDASPMIRNVEMSDNLAIAIFTDGTANPMIKDSVIRDTKEAKKNPREMIGGYGISIGPEAAPVLENNTYANNAEDVVYRE